MRPVTRLRTLGLIGMASLLMLLASGAWAATPQRVGIAALPAPDEEWTPGVDILDAAARAAGVASIELRLGSNEAAELRRVCDALGLTRVLVARRDASGVAIELRDPDSGGLIETRRGGFKGPRAGAQMTRTLADAFFASPELAPIPDPVDPAAAALAEIESGEDEGGDSLLGDLRSEGPIEIKSEELEAVRKGDERHLVFRSNVRVVQGDLTLRTDKLDAFYPKEASQPSRLIANGHVQVEQGDRRARCDRATYLRAENEVVCRGRAKLTQGCDVVRGREIRFDLEREHFRVIGAASVVLRDAKGASCEGGTS